MALRKDDRSIDGVMEQWSSGLGGKIYGGFGSSHSLLKIGSIALISIIPLLHHSIPPENSGMTENRHEIPFGADQGNVLWAWIRYLFPQTVSVALVEQSDN